ncbi:MAG: aldo/keto reductase [Alphaproteobacteria bacterium]|jgi:2,5-diketo-D-gluconate reductase B|nr:aldo/keto reductase [Alphaproteobacteria bacterium]MBU1553147.1 aldo/keto reductase [Alphaproteobacteria bacterium]MBU2338122.1 aldo/keto reductase [Alphaproteobacteria bacterium]MBU2386675.1 aldo/keto reductase [Alphaproteobacteria bacterium]
MTYTSPIPQLGLGTFGRTGDAGIQAILSAIEVGYRHIDTAQSYDTEGSVGEAIRRSGLPRSDFFVTTKVADTNLSKRDFLPSVEKSFEAIGIDPVDLLLIHWPSQNDEVPFDDYMLALAEARQRGWTRHIGVSNFPIALLDKAFALLGEDAVITDQVEIHPYLQAPRLVSHCRSKGLVLTAYQPLCKGAVNDDPLLKAIAKSHGVTAAAVALAFLMAEGHAVIPASSSIENLKNNFASQDVNLTADEISRIRTLDRSARHINPAKSPRWDD